MCETKICSKCGEEKKISKFNFCYKNDKQYIRGSCRKCDKGYIKKGRHKKSQEELLLYRQDYYATNKNKILEMSKKRYYTKQEDILNKKRIYIKRPGIANAKNELHKIYRQKLRDSYIKGLIRDSKTNFVENIFPYTGYNMLPTKFMILKFLSSIMLLLSKFS